VLYLRPNAGFTRAGETFSWAYLLSNKGKYFGVQARTLEVLPMIFRKKDFLF